MEEIFTSFSLPIEKIPQAKSWKVGGNYKVVANVEQVGIRKERDWRSEDMEIALSKKTKTKKEKPKFKTMVEFKVTGVSALAKALNNKK